MNRGGIKKFGLAYVLTSNLADGILVGAVPLLAYQITDNILHISMVSLVRPLSLLLCGVVIDYFLEKYSNQSLIRVSSTFRLLTILLFIVYVGFYDLTLIALVFFLMFFSLFELVVDSIISTLPKKIYRNNTSKKMKNFNSDIQLFNSISNDLIGPTLAGLVIAFSALYAFYTIFLLVFFSLIIILQIDRVLDCGQTVKRKIMNCHFTQYHRKLLIISILLSFCFGMYASIFVIHAITTVGVSSHEYGVLLSIFSLGCIVHRIAPNIVSFTSNNFLIGIVFIMLSTLISVNAHGFETLALAQILAGFGFMKWIVEESNFKLLYTNKNSLEFVNARFRIWETCFFSIGALFSGLWLHLSSTYTTSNVYIVIFFTEALFIMPMTILFFKSVKETKL